jgi:hypothetical protein
MELLCAHQHLTVALGCVICSIIVSDKHPIDSDEIIFEENHSDESEARSMSVPLKTGDWRTSGEHLVGLSDLEQ